MLIKDKKVLLSAGGFIDADGIIYFDSKEFGFFQCNKNTGEVNALSIKAEKGKGAKRAFIGGCKYKDKIIFSPYFASEILVYNILSPEDVERINPTLLLKNSELCFHYYLHAVACSNLIYFIGEDQSEIIYLDMDKMEVFICSAWKELAAEIITDQKNIGLHTYDMCIVDQILWAPLNYNNHILEMDLRTRETRIHKVNVSSMQFATICFDGINFWLTGEKKQIIKWNKNTGTVEIIEDFPDNFMKDSSWWNDFFVSSFYVKGYVYLFPMTANMAFKINVQTQKIDIFYQWDTMVCCEVVEKWDENSFYIEWKKKRALDMDNSIIIDLEGNVKDTGIFTIEGDKIEWSDCEGENELYLENYVVTLEKFLKNRVCCNNENHDILCGESGKKIYLEGKRIRADQDLEKDN